MRMMPLAACAAACASALVFVLVGGREPARKPWSRPPELDEGAPCASLCGTFGELCLDPASLFPRHETDPAQLPELLIDVAESPLFWHFPMQCLEGQRIVAMSYLPELFQGGGHLLLVTENEASTAATIAETMLANASRVGVVETLRGEQLLPPILSGLTSMAGHDRPPSDLAGYEWLSGAPGRSLPESTILFLTISPDEGEAWGWHHGRMSGVTVSPSREHITYWANWW